MPDEDPVRLKQETLTVSSVGGKTAIVMGFLLLAVGGFVAGIGLKIIPVDPESVNAPYWVLTAIGALFGVPGLFLIPQGIRGIMAGRRRRHELERRPSEPWLADRNWNEGGAVFTGTRRFVTSAIGAVFMVVFMLPFNWWAFFSGEGWIPIMLFVGLFDLLLLLVVFEAVRRFLAMLRYGRSEVLFDSFPFFVGDALSVRFRRPANSVFVKLTFALQCVEERLETSGSGKNRSTRKVPWALWREEVVLDEATGAATPHADNELRFDLPADRPGNRLGKSPPTYWQLRVTGEAAGPDYEGRFLLPVYRG